MAELTILKYRLKIQFGINTLLMRQIILFRLPSKVLKTILICLKKSMMKIISKLWSNIQDDAKIIDTFSEKINSCWMIRLKFRSLKLSTLPRTTKLDKYIANLIKANREAYKGILTKKIPPLFICSSEEYKNNLKQLYSIMIKLIDIVKEVDKRLMEEKNERNSYTFFSTYKCRNWTD